MDTYGERYNAAVAAQLQGARAVSQLTVDELATKAQMVRGTLLRYLTAKRDIPLPALAAISRALDIEPSVILDRATNALSATEE